MHFRYNYTPDAADPRAGTTVDFDLRLHQDCAEAELRLFTGINGEEPVRFETFGFTETAYLVEALIALGKKLDTEWSPRLRQQYTEEVRRGR